MVEITVERDFKVEGDDYIAIKKQSFNNGKGKKVVQIMEEHNISIEEMDNVINELAAKEMEELDKTEEKHHKDIAEIREEVVDYLADPEYLAFKKVHNDEKADKFLQVMTREKLLNTSDEFMSQLEKQRSDVADWKQQMINLKLAAMKAQEEQEE